MKKIILLITISLFFSSCNLLFKVVFGYENVTEPIAEDMEQFINDLSLNPIHVVQVKSDSGQFEQYADYGMSKKYQDLMRQPIQAYLFKGGDLIFFVANCLVPLKFPNSHWNYEGKFDTFPPKCDANLDSLGLNFTKLNLQDLALNQKYVYLINWNLTSNRQSKLLIKEIKRNILTHDKQDSTILILNNTDDFFIKSWTQF